MWTIYAQQQHFDTNIYHLITLVDRVQKDPVFTQRTFAVKSVQKNITIDDVKFLTVCVRLRGNGNVVGK